LSLEGHAYTPTETRDYEDLVFQYALIAFRKAKIPMPILGPIKFTCDVYRNRVATATPDLDNCIKSLTDGLCSGRRLLEDAQIVEIAARKHKCLQHEQRAEILLEWGE